MQRPTALLTHESVAEFWRRRFRRQKHVNAGVRSLLQKYGVATSSERITADLLLTLMGNLIVSEASFYRVSSDQRHATATVAFGRTPVEDLPVLAMSSAFVGVVLENASPRLLNALPRTATDGEGLSRITDEYKAVAALQFDNQVQGIVFLGAKVSGASYTDNDMELIDALCAVSAAVLSYMERQKLSCMTENRAGRLVDRCREVAGGIADHLEHTLGAVDELIADNGLAAADATERLSGYLSQIKFLVTPLRILGNDPASLESQTHEHYDPVAAIDEAALSFDLQSATRTYALSLRHDLRAGERPVGISRPELVGGLRATLRLAVAAVPEIGCLDIHVDHCDRTPSELGHGDTRQSGSVLRVKIEATTGAGEHLVESGGSMNILAENLSAYQTLRDPDSAQQAIIDSGGMIVTRQETAMGVWIIYLPMSLT